MELPSGSFEVIIVDDGGEQNLNDLIEQFRSSMRLKLVRQENRGPAHARNTGAKEASGKFLAFTDDDCCPGPEWLENFAIAFQDNEEVLLGGQTINGLKNNLYSEASQVLIEYLYSYYNQPSLESQFFASNNMAIPRSLFLKIDGFDVTTLKATAEDREICDRLLFTGHKLIFVPKAEIFHFHKLDFFSLWRQHFNYGKGAYYFRKVRAIRGQERLKVEPLSFYSDLVLYPFRNSKNSPVALSFLLFYIQVANVFGFMWESFVRGTLGEEVKAKV
jgi:GT2 family glycosyltransferase